MPEECSAELKTSALNLVATDSDGSISDLLDYESFFVPLNERFHSLCNNRAFFDPNSDVNNVGHNFVYIKTCVCTCSCIALVIHRC